MGGDSLSEILVNTHLRANRYRCIDRLVNTIAFKSIASHDSVRRILIEGDVDALKELLQGEKGLTLYDLKLQAKNLGIKNYSRLNRQELELCIKNSKKNISQCEQKS